MNDWKIVLEIARRIMLASIFLAGFSARADGRADRGGLALANTSFAFDLLKQVAGEQPGSNVFISPYSVSSALQMTGDGAAGGTKEEMERVLRLNAMTAPDAACESLDQAVTNGQTNVILNLANSIWYKEGIELKPDFLSRCANFFSAKVGAVDFASPRSAETINDWASKNTHGRIRDIVSWPMNPLTRLILANAIYFKGQWAHKFDKSATKEHAFTLPGGMQRQVPMMRQSRHFDYYQAQGFQAVRLPYAGGRLQMYLFLPDAGSSIRQLLNGFDGDTWENKILPRFWNREGTVMLPRFELNYAVTLNEPLKALGMKLAFSSDADFSAMSDEKLFVSEVKQKSFVDVDEEGTEAAAVTTVHMVGMAVRMPEPPFEMILDHPFFFVIGDENTRAILFMGIVTDPSEKH